MIGTIDLVLTACAAQEFTEAAASRGGAEPHIDGLEAGDDLCKPRDGPRRISADGSQGAMDEPSVGGGAGHVFAIESAGSAVGDGQK